MGGFFELVKGRFVHANPCSLGTQQLHHRKVGKER